MKLIKQYITTDRAKTIVSNAVFSFRNVLELIQANCCPDEDVDVETMTNVAVKLAKQAEDRIEKSIVDTPAMPAFWLSEKQGEWTCSNCGRKAEAMYRYCSYCGRIMLNQRDARMDGDEK